MQEAAEVILLEMQRVGILAGVNGNGATCSDSYKAIRSGAGGYYSYCTVKWLSINEEYEGWFGEGGAYVRGIRSSAGDGGIAGSGGTIKYSKNAEIYAYNGDRITTGDHDSIYYEYNKDGNLSDVQAKPVTFINGKKTIIPAKIFAQDGIRREVYNIAEYMPEEDKIKYGVTDDSYYKNTSGGEWDVRNVRILEEITIDSYGQGIGSGAGYIEISNGTFNEIND